MCTHSKCPESRLLKTDHMTELSALNISDKIWGQLKLKKTDKKFIRILLYIEDLVIQL